MTGSSATVEISGFDGANHIDEYLDVPSKGDSASTVMDRVVDGPTVGSDRTGRMVRNFAKISGGLVATMVSNLLLVPILYRHLGPEGFGVWALISGVQVMLLVFDLGNSLVHRLTPVLAVDDRTSAGRLVGGALAATVGAAVVLLATYASLSQFIDWADVWNVHGSLASDARTSTTILVLAVAALLPASLAEKLNLARQVSGRNGLIAAASAFTTLLAVIIVTGVGGGLPAVVAATLLPAVVVRVAWLGAILLKEPMLRPNGKLLGSLRLLFRSSVAFSALQVFAIVSFHSDQVVIARILGPSAVAEYAVPAKAFAVLLGVTSAFTAALWPAVLDAASRRDYRWIRAEFERILRWVALVGLVFSVGLVVLGPVVLPIWVGSDYGTDQVLLVAFAAWGLVYAITNVLGFFAISLGSLRVYVGLAAMNTAVNLLLSIVLTTRWGVSGAVWGSVISYAAVAAVPSFLIVASAIRRRESEAAL